MITNFFSAFLVLMRCLALAAAPQVPSPHDAACALLLQNLKDRAIDGYAPYYSEIEKIKNSDSLRHRVRLMMVDSHSFVNVMLIPKAPTQFAPLLETLRKAGFEDINSSNKDDLNRRVIKGANTPIAISSGNMANGMIAVQLTIRDLRILLRSNLVSEVWRMGGVPLVPRKP